MRERRSIKEWLIGKLGGVPMQEWASADHRRQLAESAHVDVSERLRATRAAFELKTQHADTMRQRLKAAGYESAFDGTNPVTPPSAENNSSERGLS